MHGVGYRDLSKSYSAANIASYVVIGLGMLFYYYEYLLRVSPSVMHTELMAHYGINDFQLANLVATYYYVYAPMQLPVGLIADKYGPFLSMIVACLLCSIGTYLFVGTEVLIVAKIGRFLVGLGSAFAFVCVLKMVALFMPNHFSLISGVTMALGQLGAMSGDVIFTYFISRMPWQLVNIHAARAGLFLTCMMSVCFFLHKQLHQREEINQQTQSLETSFCMRKELSDLLCDARIWKVCIMGLFMCLPVVIFAEFLSVEFFRNAYGFSLVQSAEANSMFFIGMALGGPSAVLMASKLGSKLTTIRIGCFMSASVLTLFVAGVVPTHLAPGLLLVMGYCTSVKVLVFSIVKDFGSSKTIATSVAFINMFVTLAGIIFQPFSGYLLHMCKQASYACVTWSYSVALAYIPLLLLLVIPVSYFVPEKGA
jgi:MFS family permease